MANYHILKSSIEDHEVEIVFHVPVPDENNTVGVNLRTALRQYMPFAASVVPWLASSNPSEVTSLQNGELYEYRATMEYDAKKTDLQKRTACDLKYTSIVNIIQNQIRRTLKYWGMDRDVA